MKKQCFLIQDMVDFGFILMLVPINGWDTNNVWHVYGWGGHTHARNNVKIIMWSRLQNAIVDHVQLLLHNGGLTERLNTLLIWRTDTSDPWHSHGMQYVHNWWFVRTHWWRVKVPMVQYATSIMNIYRSIALGIMNTISNATWKSQGTWTYLGPLIDSPMC